MKFGRRSLVGLFAGGGILLAGCIGFDDPTDEVDDWQDEPVQGEGDVIEIEARVDSSHLEPECAAVARDSVQSSVTDELDDSSDLAFARRNEPDHGEYRVYVQRVLVVSNGEPESVPDVSFERIREVTPREVHATVEYDDEYHTCEIPVFVEDVKLEVD